jgi:hypothetical protein
MGYSTKFTGELKFTTEASAPQLAALKAIMGEDCREHPEWNAPNLYYIDLELNDDFTGIKWDGAEKTYKLENLVNVLLRVMREKWPQFGLTSALSAQGEDMEDRWELQMGEDGLAHKMEVAMTGKIVTCPITGQSIAPYGALISALSG